jgi:hypothetical protein
MKGFLNKGALRDKLPANFTRKVSFILRSWDTLCSLIIEPVLCSLVLISLSHGLLYGR